MKKSGGIIYAFVFVLALLFGIALSKEPEYRCSFEPYRAGKDDSEQIIRVASAISEGELININTAGVGELSRLDGIGEKLSERIIKYRSEHGRFEVPEDILKVPGIGESRFEDIKNNISID